MVDYVTGDNLQEAKQLNFLATAGTTEDIENSIKPLASGSRRIATNCFHNRPENDWFKGRCLGLSHSLVTVIESPIDPPTNRHRPLTRTSAMNRRTDVSICPVHPSHFFFICGRSASAALDSVSRSLTRFSRAAMSAKNSSGSGVSTVSAAGLSWL